MPAEQTPGIALRPASAGVGAVGSRLPGGRPPRPRTGEARATGPAPLPVRTTAEVMHVH